jgi:RimJ/RimL family protein N-acetyltransferase
VKVIPMMLRRIPEKIETERLILRALRPGDGRAVNEAVRESIDHLRPWMTWARAVPSLAESETFARESALRYRNREELGMILLRKSDDLLVGAAGLHTIEWSVPRFEIGYWVRASLEGQGYITEAVRGLSALAFELLGAARVEIRCDARNIRSAAVAQRAGYTLEARLRWESRDPEGNLRDSLLFAMFSDAIPAEIKRTALRLHPE